MLDDAYNNILYKFSWEFLDYLTDEWLLVGLIVNNSLENLEWNINEKTCKHVDSFLLSPLWVIGGLNINILWLNRNDFV